MAVKYEELAKFTQPPCLSDFYRSYAVRYGLMAQEASERENVNGGAKPKKGSVS